MQLQGGRSRIRPHRLAGRDRVPELGRERHVRVARQHRREPGGRPAVHRLRAAEAPAHVRRRDDRPGRPVDRRVARGAARGARRADARLPELPALHPEDAARRAVALHAASRGRDAGARLEGALPRRASRARPPLAVDALDAEVVAHGLRVVAGRDELVHRLRALQRLAHLEAADRDRTAPREREQAVAVGREQAPDLLLAGRIEIGEETDLPEQGVLHRLVVVAPIVVGVVGDEVLCGHLHRG